eukprot:966306-Alexandrium_andersonii.AAC.1
MGRASPSPSPGRAWAVFMSLGVAVTDMDVMVVMVVGPILSGPVVVGVLLGFPRDSWSPSLTCPWPASL